MATNPNSRANQNNSTEPSLRLFLNKTTNNTSTTSVIYGIFWNVYVIFWNTTSVIYGIFQNMHKLCECEAFKWREEQCCCFLASNLAFVLLFRLLLFLPLPLLKKDGFIFRPRMLLWIKTEKRRKWGYSLCSWSVLNGTRSLRGDNHFWKGAASQK